MGSRWEVRREAMLFGDRLEGLIADRARWFSVIEGCRSQVHGHGPGEAVQGKQERIPRESGCPKRSRSFSGTSI